jgi:hypothetical protein
VIKYSKEALGRPWGFCGDLKGMTTYMKKNSKLE